ncbi:hypothetical protein L1887_22371 [Cichorium endivia]|nr:hypothetical protein L1887_22371 [Cichorium endivia]
MGEVKHLLLAKYTLWNAEYRIMLMRNFEIPSSNDSIRLNSDEDNEVSEDKVDKSECLCDSAMMECCTKESERLNLQSGFNDLAPEAMNYIQ